MKRFRTLRSVASAVLSAAVLVAMLAASAEPGTAVGAAGESVAAAAGLGFWGALSCIGCIGGFVVGGSLTIAGMAAFLAANPQIGILCVATCVHAMS